MATQQKAPIYVSQEVWDEVDDMSDVLRKMEEEGLKPDPEGGRVERRAVRLKRLRSVTSLATAVSSLCSRYFNLHVPS